MTRILLADDNDRFRRQVKNILAEEPDLEVIGEAGDGAGAITKSSLLKPDVILMDVRMPVVSGMDATRRIKHDQPGVKVIILTIFDLEGYRQAAAAQGADAYLTKNAVFTSLVSTIRKVVPPNPDLD